MISSTVSYILRKKFLEVSFQTSRVSVQLEIQYSSLFDRNLTQKSALSMPENWKKDQLSVREGTTQPT